MEKHFRVLLATDNRLQLKFLLYLENISHKNACQLYQILDCFHWQSFSIN